jgi:hypothetical protein
VQRAKAKSKEQRAKSKEQRAKSKEQRAKSKVLDYIHGLLDAVRLSPGDTDRGRLILSVVQRRCEFLQKLLYEYS